MKHSLSFLRRSLSLSPLLFLIGGCGNPPPTGSQPDAAPGADAAPGGTARYGHVFVFDEKTAGGAESGGITALFQTTNSSSCSSRTVGACTIVRCDIAAGGSIPFTDVSAGKVTITGGSTTAAIDPGSTGRYSYSGAFDSFAAGAQVGVSAAGADIPAFSTQVTFPSPITITTPGSTGQPVVDHTADFPIAWTGNGPKVLATLSESVPDRGVVVVCLFDGAGGSATIPAAALSDFEPATTLGSGGGEADVSIYSVSASQISPGGFPILVAAGANAFSALPTIK